jgi:hypothetical protein
VMTYERRMKRRIYREKGGGGESGRREGSRERQTCAV